MTDMWGYNGIIARSGKATPESHPGWDFVGRNKWWFQLVMLDTD
jgi:hypothetical protein